jgi:hypothetical protein
VEACWCQLLPGKCGAELGARGVHRPRRYFRAYPGLFWSKQKVWLSAHELGRHMDAVGVDLRRDQVVR